MSEVAFVTFLNTYLTTRRSEQNVEFKVSTRVCDENAQSHKLAGDTVSTALFLFQIRKYIISNAIFQKVCFTASGGPHTPTDFPEDLVTTHQAPPPCVGSAVSFSPGR